MQQHGWQSYNEACYKDVPVESVIEVIDGIYQNTVRFWQDVQIWSTRCESTREKTKAWLKENILFDQLGSEIILKLRPIGDTTPDYELKERWLDEQIATMWPNINKDDPEEALYIRKNPIDFVFDADQKSIEMWQRRGIFVFDVNQGMK